MLFSVSSQGKTALEFSQPQKKCSAQNSHRIAIWRLSEEKTQKTEYSWEKLSQTLILSGKLTIIKTENDGNTLDKH